jgi:hypothetical protein
MIAQQVAGKATRDTLYLVSFDVTTLPAMMAISALISVLAALWLSKLMLRHSPQKVVPAVFAVSGLLLLAAWAVSGPLPRWAAVAVYLHSALFSAALISAFWSYVNERFDPHTGKRAIGWIAGAGTLGGVVGGLVAWRASSVIDVATMLPLLAAMNAVCVWGSLRAREPASPTPKGGAAQPSPAEGVSIDEFSPIRILREAPYLQNLALVVGLGAVTSGLLDYLFSVEAVKTHPGGADLLSFFALFWLAVGVLSFLIQVLLGGFALSKLGLAFTIALLPGVVVAGGVLVLAAPGMWSMAILRGGESIQRNSLFRAAYELLYTPLSEQRKRSTKLLIDVGFDRIGTVAASAVIFATLQLASTPERASVILVVLTVASALAALTRSSPLHMAYVPVLEESLRAESEKLGDNADDIELLAPRESVTAHEELVEQLKDLPVGEAAGVLIPEPEPAPLEGPPAAISELATGVATSHQAIQDLLSGVPKRVRGVLDSEQPLSPPLVPFAIFLLASPEFHRDALGALRKIATRITGQLADALCDPSMPFEVRRRIPRVLSASPTQAAADALIRGAEDERFEVRYECGRALLQITEGNDGEGKEAIRIPLEIALEIVKREVASSKDVLDSQRELEFDEEESAQSALIDRMLRDRFDRIFEHVFSMLALVLDRESIRLAFKALHQEDPRLRGTALEYLETVLPDEIRDAVWPYLGEARPRKPARPADEILADLLSVREAAASEPEREPERRNRRTGSARPRTPRGS